MRRMNSTLSRLLLVALAVAAFVGLTTSASAAPWGPNQHVQVRAYLGHVGVSDHDGDHDFEHAKYNIDGKLFGKLSPISLNFTSSPSYCAGDEVRVHLVVKGQTFINDSTVKVTAQLVMYEGASCNSNDLDGVGTPVTFTMKPGGISTQYLSVKNTDEGGDWAGALITFEAVSGVGL